MLRSIITFGLLLVGATLLPAQTFKNVTPAEAKQLIDKGGVIILDVRTEGEWNQGHLKGATRIDVMDKQFKQKVSKLDKSKPIVVYCAVGGRSAYASDDMVKLGFTKVYNMDGGIKGWRKAGFPLQN
ncbi:MAG: rhodanese-like domain-containing protein [Bradyrhizobiaceae bacterium]|nr:rhodanese-like domain-containing protein [Bradyrhizobiaceae bacterium]